MTKERRRRRPVNPPGAHRRKNGPPFIRVTASEDRLQLLAVDPSADDPVAFACSLEEFVDVVWAVLREPALGDEVAGRILKTFLATNAEELLDLGLPAALAARLCVRTEDEG